ncbi:serine protease [Streptomyces sp. ISL-98]|uniref:S1 family peptidase n=1 Tax=Streptomyces sp. ISL-98 TaxID=2819192 RepID=UPI001BE52E18|nr:serine protease [Streptomyces sp. ISL-98]MBT2511489.1 serine protease [Streptomyces sp. ISL-98]
MRGGKRSIRRSRTHKGVRAAVLTLAIGGVSAGVFSAAHGAVPLIVGGQQAPKTYPFMGSLQQAGKHVCGATLINSRVMVTAQHCVQGMSSPGALTVRIGSNDRSSGGTVAQVAEVVTPGSSSDIRGADIALLKLSREVPNSPAEIASAKSGNGAPLHLIGWGQSCPERGCEQEPPRTLKELTTPLQPDSACQEIVPGRELCVGGTRTDTACFGDSGGPALVDADDRLQLVGATSRAGGKSATCGVGNVIYTDVTAFREWIDKNDGPPGSSDGARPHGRPGSRIPGVGSGFPRFPGRPGIGSGIPGIGSGGRGIGPGIPGIGSGIPGISSGGPGIGPGFPVGPGIGPAIP